MLPLLVFTVLLAAVATGFLLIGRLKPTLETSYSMLYVYLVFASIFFSSFSTLGAVAGLLLAIAMLTPWLKHLQPSLQKNSIPQLASTTLLLTLVVKTIYESGLEFPMLSVFLVAFVFHTLVYARMGQAIAQAVAASTTLMLLAALSNVSASFFPAEITPLMFTILLLAAASASVKTASTYPQAFTAVGAAVLLFIIIGLFLSPLSGTQTSIRTELGPESLLIIPAAFAALSPSLSRNSVRFGDAVMASAAAGLAIHGVVFHTSLANLLTPLTGLPNVDASAALIQRVVQVIALAAAVSIVGDAVKTGHGVKMFGGRAPNQLLPMLAVLLALAAATSTASLNALFTGLGAVNMITISTVLINGGVKRKLFAGLLLILGIDFAATSALQLIRISTDPFTLLALLPAAVVTVSAAQGIWLFSKSVKV